MRKLLSINVSDVIFINLETEGRDFDELKYIEKEVWRRKFVKLSEAEGYDIKAHYEEKSALYAEFAKVKCIQLAHIVAGVHTTSNYEGDERKILKQINRDLLKHKKANKNLRVAGFALTGFALPFMSKRFMINNIVACDVIDQSEKKPWEVDDDVLDLKRLWKSTGYTSVSLEGLCVALGVYRFRIYEEPISKIQAIGDCYMKMSGGADITEYSHKPVLELKEIPLMQQIFSQGSIDSEQLTCLVSKCSSFEYKDKELAITIIRSALLANDSDLSPEIENILLSC